MWHINRTESDVLKGSVNYEYIIYGFENYIFVINAFGKKEQSL